MLSARGLRRHTISSNTIIVVSATLQAKSAIKITSRACRISHKNVHTARCSAMHAAANPACKLGAMLHDTATHTLLSCRTWVVRVPDEARTRAVAVMSGPMLTPAWRVLDTMCIVARKNKYVGTKKPNTCPCGLLSGPRALLSFHAGTTAGNTRLQLRDTCFVLHLP